jgi:hypothetical protein
LKYHHFYFIFYATETTDIENNAFSLALILDFTSKYARIKNVTSHFFLYQFVLLTISAFFHVHVQLTSLLFFGVRF